VELAARRCIVHDVALLAGGDRSPARLSIRPMNVRLPDLHSCVHAIARARHFLLQRWRDAGPASTRAARCPHRPA